MAESDDAWRRRTLYGLQTEAVVLHCPGPLRSASDPMHVEWDRAQETFFADTLYRRAFRDHPDLTIITYNTLPGKTLLERCADHLGLDVTALGSGLTDWRWDYKISLVREHLQSAPTTRYVMCLDAFDTLILASPAQIVERFRRTEVKILFGGTASDWPPSPRHRLFEIEASGGAPPEHCHLNASYIGETTAVIDCLDEIMAALESTASWARTATGFDDQLAWRELHRRRYPSLKVDCGCAIFARFDRYR